MVKKSAFVRKMIEQAFENRGKVYVFSLNSEKTDEKRLIFQFDGCILSVIGVKG